MPTATALLAVDLQRGVLRGCFDADGVLRRSAQLVDRARASGVPVIWVQDHGSFAEGTDQWALAASLERGVGEPLVRNAYRDSFAGTDLADVLASSGVQHLVVGTPLSDTTRCSSTPAGDRTVTESMPGAGILVASSDGPGHSPRAA